MKTLQKVTLAIALITLFASCQSSTDIKQVLSKSDTINIMKGFTTNIEKATLENNSFRKVLYTAKYSQLVLMNLQPKEEIGMETHEKNDQFFRFESGHGKCIIDGNAYEVTAGDAVIVPAGAKHNIINTSDTGALKLYTIYSPPNHKDGVIHQTKKEAETDEEKFEGTTTE
ncbi:MAG TPA: cupin domain-containing protein [Chitinophagaceae bacterium]